MQIGNSLGKLTSSRGGAILLGVAAAVLAAILLAVYVTRYRDSVKSGTVNVPVLQATHLIPKGTPGDLPGRSRIPPSWPAASPSRTSIPVTS